VDAAPCSVPGQIEVATRTPEDQILPQACQPGRDEVRVFERSQQGQGDAVEDVNGFQVSRAGGKLAVARAVLEGGEFHVGQSGNDVHDIV